MKTIKFYFATLFLATALVACDNDDDNTPDPVNEEEVITTLTFTLTPQGGGDAIVFQSRDLDGDGPDAPILTEPMSIPANTTFNGTVTFLNETESPAEDITIEVVEEADEHQVFYIPGTGLNVTTEYTSFDADGNPLGTSFTLTTTDASNGILNVVLRHEPTKPNDGTLADAGGETDISVVFDVNVE